MNTPNRKHPEQRSNGDVIQRCHILTYPFQQTASKLLQLFQMGVFSAFNLSAMYSNFLKSDGLREIEALNYRVPFC